MTQASPPKIPPHFCRRNERGLIEVVDILTGRILCIQSSERTLLEKKWEQLVQINTPDGVVWIEKNLNFDLIKKSEAYPYSQLLGDLLCERVAMGGTLPAACVELRLPYSIVLRWRREVAEFREQLLQSERDRADYLHDEVLHIARTEASTREKLDSLKWSAAAGAPEKYGTKKQDIAISQPIQFIVSTGISRDVAEAAPAQVAGEGHPLVEPAVQERKEETIVK